MAQTVPLFLLCLALRAAAVLRWGYVGCGSVTETKSPPSAFRHSGVSDVLAVSRRNATLAASFASRHGVARHYGSPAALVSDPDVTAVYVATPPGSHLEVARLVASVGKACVLEKPMARTLGESRAIAEAFSRKNVPLFVAYYRRSYPRMKRLQRMIRERVGKVRSVEYTCKKRRRRIDVAANDWRYDAKISGGGLFVDVGSHVLDLLDFLFGPLADVTGDADGPGPPLVEDRVWINFSFADGAKGQASWDFTSKRSKESLVIVGDNATVQVQNLLNGNEIRLFKPGEEDAYTAFFDSPPVPVHGPFIESVVDALVSGHRERCPSTPDTALRTAAVIDKVLNKYWGGNRATHPDFFFT